MAIEMVLQNRLRRWATLVLSMVLCITQMTTAVQVRISGFMDGEQTTKQSGGTAEFTCHVTEFTNPRTPAYWAKEVPVNASDPSQGNALAEIAVQTVLTPFRETGRYKFEEKLDLGTRMIEIKLTISDLKVEDGGKLLCLAGSEGERVRAAISLNVRYNTVKWLVRQPMEHKYREVDAISSSWAFSTYSADVETLVQGKTSLKCVAEGANPKPQPRIYFASSSGMTTANDITYKQFPGRLEQRVAQGDKSGLIRTTHVITRVAEPFQGKVERWRNALTCWSGQLYATLTISAPYAPWFVPDEHKDLAMDNGAKDPACSEYQYARVGDSSARITCHVRAHPDLSTAEWIGSSRAWRSNASSADATLPSGLGVEDWVLNGTDRIFTLTVTGPIEEKHFGEYILHVENTWGSGSRLIRFWDERNRITSTAAAATEYQSTAPDKTGGKGNGGNFASRSAVTVWFIFSCVTVVLFVNKLWCLLVS